MTASLYAVYVYVLLYYYCVNYINIETMSYFRPCKLKRNCQQLAGMSRDGAWCQWRTEGGLGVQPPPEIPKISVESSIA